ncbi:MAG: bifunctional glycosyltransferase family 2/GtrA family protein [Ruminococcus sp.]|nr:bifunctional glycosyltransferase family 2/GtrA family protein [Ruminococcus sp.]
MKRIALIPAYMPDEKMVGIVWELYTRGFAVVIVNDGSPREFDDLFEKSSGYAQIITHKENKGKGEALKTGLKYIKVHFDTPYTVINVDADGQHKIEDIIRVAELAEVNRSSLVLGSRKLDGKVPFKSKAGNAITRLVYRLSTGSGVYDTQTGLRAYSDKLVDRLLRISGSRYEYEMNMLMELPRDGYEVKEVWIDTVYINNNEASHFDPVKDSAKIYKEILKFSASSLIGFGVDYVLFCLLSALTGSLVLANVFARIVSGTVNFTLNRKVVFKSDSHIVAAALKYIALAVFILICNTLVLKGLTSFGLAAYVAKIITEIILFIFNYLVQHSFIFRKAGKDA